MTDHGGAASPRTEAGKRDHEDGWTTSPRGETHWGATHTLHREGCPGCAWIAKIEAEAAQEAPAPEGLRAAIEYDAIPALLVFAEGNAGVRAVIAKLRAALATPPTPAEPPQGQRLVLKAGVLIDLDAPDRAEARPPEGLDAALESLRTAHPRQPAGHRPIYSDGWNDALDALAARLSAGGATKPPEPIELPQDRRDLASDLPGSY